MKRVIVTYEKLTTDILDLLVEKYPDGYEYEDIISFKNAKGLDEEKIDYLLKNGAYLD